MLPIPHDRPVAAGILFLIATLALTPAPPLAAKEAAVTRVANSAPAAFDPLDQKTVATDADGFVQQRLRLGSLGLLEAVETSLAKSLDLVIQQETANIAEGQFHSQGGAFDVMVSGGVNHGLMTTKLNSAVRAQAPPYRALDAYQTTTSLALSKQLRTGPTLSLSSQLLRNSYSEQQMAIYADTASPLSTAIVKLEATIPLLNGAGRFAAADENAAQFNFVAAEFAYLQAIASNTLTVVQKYWEYKAAFLAYDVNLAMEGVITELLHRQPDVAAPTATENSIIINTLNARAADASRDTSQARQNITTSRQALALAMGIDVADFATVAVPTDDLLLDLVSLPTDETAYLRHLNQTAEAHRPDLKSLTYKVKAAQLQVAKAKNALKPHLDLVGNIGYTGMDEESGVGDYLSATTDSENGESWAVGATFSYPLGNHGAKGTMLSQEAARRISTAQRDNLNRQIGSQLTVGLAALKRWISSLKQANTSVEQYRQALSTLMGSPIRSNAELADILAVQEKLRDAAINRAETLDSFAKAIAELRFDSGTLVGLKDDKSCITLESLTTLP